MHPVRPKLELCLCSCLCVATCFNGSMCCLRWSELHAGPSIIEAVAATERFRTEALLAEAAEAELVRPAVALLNRICSIEERLVHISCVPSAATRMRIHHWSVLLHRTMLASMQPSRRRPSPPSSSCTLARSARSTSSAARLACYGSVEPSEYTAPSDDGGALVVRVPHPSRH